MQYISTFAIDLKFETEELAESKCQNASVTTFQECVRDNAIRFPHICHIWNAKTPKVLAGLWYNTWGQISN